MEDRYREPLTKWSGDVEDLPGIKEMMEYFGRRGRYRIGDWKRFTGWRIPTPPKGTSLRN